MSFTGKVVLVTGGSSGIGAAAALAFAKEGAKVAIVGRNEKKLNAVATNIAELTPPLVIRADVADDNQAATIVKKTVDHFGKLDFLVNNAGITGSTSIFDANLLSAYDKIMAINLRAVIHITSLAVPELIKTKGNIINISSVGGEKTMNSLMAYLVSKAGLNHFTRCTALELAPHGVRVNTVSPGPVKTDILENSDLEATEDDFKAMTALKKVAEAEELADLIVFLASEKAKSITGSNYTIDNGFLLL